MKFEESKNESTIEETIDEIKEAEAEKEIESAVEKFKTKAVAEAVKNEMPAQKEGKDDIEKITGIESIIEEMGINPDAQERKEAKEKLVEYAERINDVGKIYQNAYEFFEPQGAEGRDYSEEFDLFIEKRKDNPEHCPSFEYPEIEKLDLNKINEDKEALIDISKDIEKEKNDSLKTICNTLIHDIESKIKLLESMKEKDFDSAFIYATEAYGDISDELVKFAEKVYEKKEQKESPEKEKIKKQLKSAIFEPEDFKNYFEMLIKKAGFDKDGWEVIITSKVKAIDPRAVSKEYDHPVVFVPEKRNQEADGLKFFKLMNHEFIHIITQTYNRRNGFGGMSFGSDYETFSEGIVKMGEKDAEEEIFEEKYDDSKVDSHPYYVLGMKKVKDGANFPQTFDYLVGLYKKELEEEGINKDEINDKAIKKIKAVCRRIFRGFDPKEGGRYFPKDKAYLQGEAEAGKMKKEGVVDYLYQSKVDPKIIPYLIKMDGYTKKEGLKKARELVIQI